MGGRRRQASGERARVVSWRARLAVAPWWGCSVGGGAGLEFRMGRGCGLDEGQQRGWRCGRGGSGRWGCERQRQRSCIGEPVHGSAVSLLSKLSTLSRSQLLAVPSTAGGHDTSARIRTHKCLDVGRCPLLTHSGPALALSGHHSPETGRASTVETALVSLGWSANSRGRHADGSWATCLRGSAGHCGRRRPFDRHDSASDSFQNLRGCDHDTRHALERIRSKLVPKGLHVSR